MVLVEVWLFLLLLLVPDEGESKKTPQYFLHDPPRSSLALPQWGLACQEAVQEYVSAIDRAAFRLTFEKNPHTPPMKRRPNRCFPKAPLQYESMAETNPSLAIELDMENNDRFITPWSVVAGTGYYLSWRCLTCKHRYKARGADRVKPAPNARGCPFCAGQAVHVDGRACMAFTDPSLTRDFDWERNQLAEPGWSPLNLRPATRKKLHWKCDKCTHRWTATGDSRSTKGRGCPYCAGNALHSDGRNAMAVTHPKLAQEFDFVVNADMLPGLTPRSLLAGTHKKVGWECAVCAHKWVASGNNRSRGTGCPKCKRPRTADGTGLV